MNTKQNSVAPEPGHTQYKDIGGFKIDLVKDEAEDLVLDLVDEVATGEDRRAHEIVSQIARLAATRPGFKEATLKTMNYLLSAYSKPDYRFRPDLNKVVGLQHVNAAEEMLRHSLAL